MFTTRLFLLTYASLPPHTHTCLECKLQENMDFDCLAQGHGSVSRTGPAHRPVLPWASLVHQAPATTALRLLFHFLPTGLLTCGFLCRECPSQSPLPGKLLLAVRTHGKCQPSLTHPPPSPHQFWISPLSSRDPVISMYHPALCHLPPPPVRETVEDKSCLVSFVPLAGGDSMRTWTNNCGLVF